jgi:predicted Ser/Thr protein kinase
MTLPRRRWGSKSGTMAQSSSNLMDGLQQALDGRYDIERELGRGTMGIVYLAWERKLERLVALKLLPPERADGRRRERFLREARIAARLKHPNIVPIHAVEEVGGFVYFTMDYVDGETLFDRVLRDGPLPAGEASRILFQVADAMGHAHAKGVVHRDLKPNNILLEAVTSRPLVTDFGIAEVATNAPHGPEPYIAGTAPFISPEQVLGYAADARSDVYALGITAYFTATGTLPFLAKTPLETLEQHVSRPAPPLAVVGPHFDTTLRRVVARCLAKEPDERFQNGAELAQGLGAAAELRSGDPVELSAMLMGVRQIGRYGSGLGVLGLVGLSLAGGAVARGSWGSGALGLGLMGLALAAPVVLLMPTVRRLLAAGFTRSDIIHILSLDLDRQRRVQALTQGRPAPGARKASLVAYAWIAVFGVGAVLAAFRAGLPERLVIGGMLIGALTTLFAGAIAVYRNRQRNALVGDRWLKLWASPVGAWLARLAGTGLPVAPEALPEPDPRLAQALPVSPDEWAARRQEFSEISETLAQRIRQWKANAEARGELVADGDARLLAGKAMLEDYLRRFEELRMDASAMGGTVGAELEAARALCDEVSRLLEGRGRGAAELEGLGP